MSVKNIRAVHGALVAVALMLAGCAADPAAEDVDGRRNAFAPTTGRNVEAGAKYDLPDQRAALTLSVFRTEVSNGLVQSGPADLNPNGNRYFMEAGTRRSRGVEASADVQATRDLHVTGSVTWLDAIYTGEGPASAISMMNGVHCQVSTMTSDSSASRCWVSHSTRPSPRLSRNEFTTPN